MFKGEIIGIKVWVVSSTSNKNELNTIYIRQITHKLNALKKFRGNLVSKSRSGLRH